MAEEELGFGEMVRVYVAVFLLEFSAVLEMVTTSGEEFRYKGIILKGKPNKNNPESCKYMSETIKTGGC